MTLSEKIFNQASQKFFELKEKAFADKIIAEIDGLNKSLREAGSNVVFLASHEKDRHKLKIQKEILTGPVMWSGQIKEEKPDILIEFSTSKDHLELRSGGAWFTGLHKYDYTLISNFHYDEDERFSENLAEKILGLLDENELEVLHKFRMSARDRAFRL